MVFSRNVATRLQPYFGHRSADRLVLSARALRSAPAAFGEGSRWRAIRTMMAQFASREVGSVDVRLVIEGEAGTLLDQAGTTDHEGFVHFDIALSPAWDLPDHPAWEVAQLRWINSEGPQSADAHILVPGKDSNLAVISDIDDTIIESGITGGPRNIARNWKRVLAQLPHERIAVPGADAFYGALGGGVTATGEKHGAKMMPATHRPFFYISSSPWNLFSYLVAFQRLKGLPLGPIHLRDWGFNRETFGSGSHGAHKEAAIASILGMYPAMQFALIGDDTQGDLPAFAHAVETHPGRVAAVFLRSAAGEAFSPEEQVAKATIEAAGVPLWLGESYEQGVDFLGELGFTPGGETEQIVRTVEKVETAKESRDQGVSGP
ncbi:phosphatase domain-containing protein [Aurantiacibacter marinus]|uniref:Phosphatidate phosphatase APP1 catalytic domain-containing protein n=1 Tax=Aurantiacibacter marinus TaxID=874156 RepID=A0A0H0XRQ6_9SPHN|nr:phosphatase domain-containing protein [Aurantiacibacter marinus]KLI64686.1 hypothetical protein AAV99_03880 [Aurantiacibacter marinus]